MAVPAKLGELNLRNMTELWADSAESKNGRRLPHNFGLLQINAYISSQIINDLTSSGASHDESWSVAQLGRQTLFPP
jgi:hypothetical protein